MKRKTKRQRSKRQSAVQQLPKPTSGEAAVAPRGLLIPTEQVGLCVVFADGNMSLDLDFGQFHEFPLLPKDARHALAQGVEQACTTGNLGLQIAHGAMQAQGLVQLSPETLAMLSQGTNTLQNGGWNIGALAGEGGQFVSTVKWLPAGAAAPLAVASTAGLALALMAIQWQQNRIERISKRALVVATEALVEIRADQHNEVAAKVKRLRNATAEAKAAGSVTQAVWEGFGGQAMETSLDTLRRNAEMRIARMQAELSHLTKAKDRIDWMNRNAGELVQDLITLVQSVAALWCYWSLRVARLLGSCVNESDSLVAATVKSNAMLELEEIRAKLTPLIEELWRYFGLVAECPGTLSMAKLWGRAKTVREAQATALRLRDTVAGIYMAFADRELVEHAASSDLAELSALRWILRPDESVRMRHDSPGFFAPRAFVFTNQRLITLKPSAFIKTGSVDAVFDGARLAFEAERSGDRVRLQLKIKDEAARIQSGTLETLTFETGKFPRKRISGIAEDWGVTFEFPEGLPPTASKGLDHAPGQPTGSGTHCPTSEQGPACGAQGPDRYDDKDQSKQSGCQSDVEFERAIAAIRSAIASNREILAIVPKVQYSQQYDFLSQRGVKSRPRDQLRNQRVSVSRKRRPRG